MPVITFANRSHPVDKEKRLLDSLLEKGEDIPFSCRSGVCHACLLKADSGKPPAASQKNLNQEKILQGYFLACQCLPEGNMSVSLPARDKIPAIITGRRFLSPTVIALELSPRYPLDYSPGQHITLWADDKLARPCYLASASEADQHLIVHIRRRVGGAFSTWAHDCTTIGQKISIGDLRGINLTEGLQLPASQSLLIAQESCLAPLLSLVKHCCSTATPHSIQLYLQADTPENLCELEQLKSLADQNTSLKLHTFTGAESLDKLLNSLEIQPSQNILLAGEQDFTTKLSDYLNTDKSNPQPVILPY